MALEGTFEFEASENFKRIIPKYILPNKDLYIDLKELDSIDIIGLNSLILTKCLVKAAGGEFYIFANKENPIFQLMDQIKLGQQFNFRNIIIQNSSYGIAS